MRKKIITIVLSIVLTLSSIATPALANVDLSKANKPALENEKTEVDSDILDGAEKVEDKPAIDKTALEAKIAEAAESEKTDYTVGAWGAFGGALSEADRVRDKANVTQEKVNEALANLTSAMEALEKVEETAVDKSSLEVKITEAATLVEENYTVETWGIFAAALATAQSVMTNNEATQEKVDNALNTLTGAINSLEVKDSGVGYLTAVVAETREDKVVVGIGKYSVAYSEGQGNQLYDYLSCGTEGVKLIGVVSGDKYMQIGQYSIYYGRYGSEGAITNTPALSQESIRDYQLFSGFDESGNPILTPLFGLVDSYTVTFKDYDGSIIDTQTVKHGEDATAPEDPTREGYIFTGWDGNFTDVTSDLTITAQYELEEKVQAVIRAIADLPAVEALTIENKGVVEEARTSYDALTDEQKALVTNYTTLTTAERKIAEFDVDERISGVIGVLKLTDTGISKVTYENKKATFTISELGTPISNFAQSGIVELFQELFKDVSSAEISVDGEVVETIENPAEMDKGKLMGEILNKLIMPLVGDNPTMTLVDLAGKSAGAKLIISAGTGVYYEGTYTVEFLRDPNIVAAETAVEAYEAASITTLKEVEEAEALEATANEKVALLAPGETKAGLEERISGKNALVDAAKADLEAVAEASSFRVTHADALNLTVETVKIADNDKVETALEAYSALSPAAKGKLTGGEEALLDNLSVKIAELKADKEASDAANSFKTDHAVILGETVGTIVIANKAAVNAALAAYEQLSELAKGKLENEKDLLDSLLVKIGKLEAEEAIENAKEAFEEAAVKITEIKSGSVAIANLAFDPDTYKAAVTMLDADKNIMDLTGTGIFSTLLPSLGVKAVTIDGKEYSLNPADEQILPLAGVVLSKWGLNSNAGLKDLDSKSITFTGRIQPTGHVEFTAEFTFNFALSAEEKERLANQAAADVVIDKINKLPPVEDLTLENKEAVIAARDAYDELTEAQKALIGKETLDKLTAAEARITELKADKEASDAANSFKTDHATVLGLTVDTITIDDKEAVNAALTAYGQLSEAAKTKIAVEKALLDSLLTKIVQLEKLEEAKAIATAKVKEAYTITSWNTLTKALALPEITSEEVVNKTTAIDVAITSLVKKSDTNDTWNGDSEAFSLLNPNNSDNSEANPYIIDTSAKLANLATQVRSGNNYEGKYFVLDANLNLNGLPWKTIGDWDGEDCHSFNGYFDGNNNTITGMKINEPNACAGLFSVTKEAQIRNLTVLNPIITRDSNPNDYGSYGVIVGEVYDSEFEGIHVINPEIKGGWWIGGLFGYCERVSITRCAVTDGSITATNWKVGGIAAGAHDATIKDCFVDGITIFTSATGFANDIGGIIGYLANNGYEKSVVKNCSFDGSVTASDNYAGGIVGHTAGVVEVANCTTKGTVTGSSYVGGILGADDGTTTIADSISSAETSGINHIGGIVGYATANTTIENNTSTGKVTGELNVGQIVGSIENKFPNGLSDDSRIIDFVNDSTYPWKHDVLIKDKAAFYPTNQGVGNSTSSFTCKVLGKGILVYDYKVSAEDGYDYLKIYIDDVLAKEYKALTDWTSDYIILSKDTQTVKFEYKKDSSADGNDDKVWIANIELCSGDVPLTLTEDGNEYGSISGTYGNNELSTGVQQIPVGTEVKLNAAANSGASFYGWVDGNGKLLSTDANYVFTLLKGIDIKAVFAQNGTYVARKDGVFYQDVATALKETVSGDTICLIDNCTLDETTMVPKGVTLMIPYNATATSPTEKGTTSTATGRVSWANESKYLYLTLTIPEGITLNVDGTITVGAVQHYPAQNYQGHTSGAYSQIICNGAINVNDSGVLDLYGLLKGSGTVTAYSGAVIYQPFMIADYAGGSNTQALFNLHQTPFKRYAMINIQTNFVMHYGAKMYGHASLYFWSSITTIDEEIIGPNGLIVLSEGAVLTASYDSNRYVQDSVAGNNLNEDIGKTTIIINGGAIAGYMEFPLSIKTDSVYFSIPYNFDIVLENGNYNFAYPYKLMPGASLWVKDSATLEVTRGFYVYDGLIQSDMSGKSYPTTAMLQEKDFSPSANFIVDGTFIVRDGSTFGGIVQTNGGGKIILEGNANVTNEVVVDGGKTNYDVNTSKFSLPARVYDADSNSLIAMEAGKTYLGQKTAESWLLTDYTATYAKNASASDYDADISNPNYHKWSTTTTAINQPMIGSW